MSVNLVQSQPTTPLEPLIQHESYLAELSDKKYAASFPSDIDVMSNRILTFALDLLYYHIIYASQNKRYYVDALKISKNEELHFGGSLNVMGGEIKPTLDQIEL